MNMDTKLFLQHLSDASLEEGRAYIQAHIEELADHAAIGKVLEDEALTTLYNPFLSLKLAEQLIFFGEFTHHLSSHALGLKAKGDALGQIGHHQAAMESLDVAGEEFLHLGDDENWARSRISWIVASASLGQVEEALQEASRAHDVFLRHGEHYWVCVIDHNTAWIYAQVGRYREAFELFERIPSILSTLTDQSEASIERAIAMAEEGQAQILSWLGKFEQAYHVHQQALARLVALNETSLIIDTEIRLANLDHIQGYYGSALRRYYQARENVIQNNIDNLMLLADLKLWMANCLVKLNRAQDSCQLMSEAVEAYRQRGTSLQASDALREYAMTLVASGRLQEALAALDEALTLFNQGGFDHYASATKLQRAELLLEMGFVEEGFYEADLIKEHFEVQGLIAHSARANLVMVGSLLQQAQQAEKRHEKERQAILIQEGVVLCKQVALQAHQHHLQEEVYKSQYLLGRLFALQGESRKAKRHYAAAITQIERILDDLVYDLSPSFLRTAWRVYEDMIALCLQQRQIQYAFGYLERARSMALRQYLNTSKTSFDEKGQREGSLYSPALLANSATMLQTQDELREWQERYRDYSVLLSQMDTSVSPSVEQGIIEAELKRCEAKLSELFERLYLYQSMIYLTPKVKKSEKHHRKHLDLTQLHQHLSPDQLLLAYFLYKGRLVIFVVTAEHITTHEIPDGMRQLKRLLSLLNAHLELRSWPNPQQPPQQAVCQMLSKLYHLLIAPVAALLPPRSGSLTIIPYGPLHQLPFHALYDGSHFLIENFQINYLPASSLLTHFDARSSDRNTHAAGVLSEGDLPKDPSTVASKPPLIFGYSGHGHLQRALEEAKTLATILDGRCYLEDEATIAQLIEQAPGSPIIHLATHGHIRLDAPNFSSVLLADGRFNAIDAFSLDLKACELVSLSGCETGLALSSGGDEQLGLGRAFLAAGAASLVMSLWPVEDNATNELMQLFYQNLLHGGSKVEALRSAQCTLIHRTGSIYTHPYYWAAFRLVGEVGSLKYLRTKERSFALKTESKKSDL